MAKLPADKFKVIINKEKRIDVDETLFQDRQVFLTCPVDGSVCDLLISQLKVLDKMNHNPISFHINSPGGSVSWGFALIDCLKSLKSPVVAVGAGLIASMASVIYISCPQRHTYSNTTFMFHDMFSGVVDYAAKMEARMDFQKQEWLMLVDHIRKHTKLSEEELVLMRSGELWLFAEEAVKKGVADKII